MAVSRQAYAGLLWSKQFYYYVIDDWLKGDPSMPCPPHDRLKGRNSEWKYLHNKDVISMPDKWEYPWVSFVLKFRPRIRPSRLVLGAFLFTHSFRKFWSEVKQKVWPVYLGPPPEVVIFDRSDWSDQNYYSILTNWYAALVASV